jgi:hypothetical protein
VDDADEDKSVLLCNSGIVLTTRISEASAGDGDDRIDEDTYGIDNVLLVVAVVGTSGVEIVVDGVDDDVGRTSAFNLSLTK